MNHFSVRIIFDYARDAFIDKMFYVVLQLFRSHINATGLEGVDRAIALGKVGVVGEVVEVSLIIVLETVFEVGGDGVAVDGEGNFFALVEGLAVEFVEQGVDGMVSKEQVIVVRKSPLVRVSRVLPEKLFVANHLGQASQIHVLDFVLESSLGVGAENAELALILGRVDRVR